ncbi:DUF4097 family beta strand repeat-containing protein [Streptomyces sp. NPDC000594]|uniref:DUF4097 family beta strand repeat-containing protein n=1 Tax=Streptomyces sp. NPDC000594 TaxID=3154261 RepID=UPI0033172063
MAGRAGARGWRGGAAGMVVGALVVALAGCGEAADAESAPAERKVFALAGKSLTIDNDNSAIEVIAADVRRVEVVRKVDGWVFIGEGPEKRWKLEDGRLTLRVQCKAVASDCEARHTVRVPRDVVVTVRSDNGSVTATGLSTPLTAVTDNGHVTVRDTTGPLDLRSDNGSTTTEGVRAERLKARSDNGDVRIGLRDGAAPDRVDIVSDNGDVHIGLPRSGGPYDVDARSENGTARVDVDRDRKSPRVVTVRSDNGDVTVRNR